jgi:hypothetical protein
MFCNQLTETFGFEIFFYILIKTLASAPHVAAGIRTHPTKEFVLQSLKATYISFKN